MYKNAELPFSSLFIVNSNFQLKCLFVTAICLIHNLQYKIYRLAIFRIVVFSFAAYYLFC